MSAFSSILLVIGLILAVIFVVVFAIGHKFRNDNQSFGRAMELGGMIGVFVCVVGVFLIVLFNLM